MTISWAAYRAQIRRSFLDDVSEVKFTDAQLLDAVGFALEEFAAHTAVASASSFTMNGTDTTITMPDNVYSSLEDTGLVILTQDDQRQNLEPIVRRPGDVLTGTAWDSDDPKRYWERPRGVINFTFVPDNNATVEVYYFAAYNHPVADDDTIDVPSWALQPLACLTAAAVFGSKGALAADIGQWDQRRDSGNPEHNPLHRHIEHLRWLYDQLIARVPVQQRDHLYQKEYR